MYESIDDESDVIGCTPLTLEPAHSNEMSELISKVPSIRNASEYEVYHKNI